MGDGPYRAGSGDEGSAPTDDAGIVSELVEQFADPYAFHRELVQNAIDAGTDAVRVTCTLDDAAGEVTIAVRDRGEGMDRDVLENRLLVLFRSGKEGQSDKIGKFGIGFVSVLALEPTVVAVHTSRGDGRAWALHLRPDYSYELFEIDGGSTSGTTVTLHVPLRREQYAELLDRSTQALTRWCRHATIPIHFRAFVAGVAEPVRESRIDRPLELEDALVSVASEYDGIGRVVVGLPRAGAAYGGFFNRGLTLWETSASLVGSLAFKVQDPRLEHTLSRDNVRRDAAYQRAMAAVVDAAKRELAPEARVRLAEWAADPVVHEYHALAHALHLSELLVDASAWTFPTIAPGEPVRGSELFQSTLRASERSPLTDALVRTGTPVLDLGSAPEAAIHDYVGVIRSVVPGWRAPDAHATLTLVAPVDHIGIDLALLDALTAILARAVRRPERPVFARMIGARYSDLCIAGGDGADPWIVPEREALRDPLRFLSRPRLVLNVEHPIVAAARRRAEMDPDVAGVLLARAVLVWLERLDAETDDTLSAAGLRAISGEP
jgi:molecular chaperone HtpG